MTNKYMNLSFICIFMLASEMLQLKLKAVK